MYASGLSSARGSAGTINGTQMPSCPKWPLRSRARHSIGTTIMRIPARPGHALWRYYVLWRLHCGEPRRAGTISQGPATHRLPTILACCSDGRLYLWVRCNARRLGLLASWIGLQTSPRWTSGLMAENVVYNWTVRSQVASCPQH